MTIAHTTAVRNVLCDAVVDLVDGGAGAGTLIYYLANGTTEVATLTFSDPAFPAASSGAALANSITSDTNATGNATDVAVFIVKDSNALEVYRGSLAVSGGDINLSSLTIAATDTVSCSALTYNASA